jgi:nitrite reductase (NADH) large subunit
VRIQWGGPAGARSLEALRCNQCSEPLCVFACKSGALHRDPLSGQMHFDEDRCVACYMCLMVCPSGVRPDPDRDRVVRCDVCEGRQTPACVAACPTGALGRDASLDERTRSAFQGRVVVVGSSAAGISACEAAREHAPDCSITLVSGTELPALYSRPLLSYALAGRIAPSETAWRGERYLQELGVQVMPGRAVGLKPGAAVLDGGTELPFDVLIVATGARVAKLAIPGADFAGVHGLRDIEDLEAIAKLTGPGRRAVVLGGGNVGLQVCEAFLERGMGVTVVATSPHLLSQMVDAEAGRRVAELFRGHGANVRTGCDAVEIVGDGRVEGVRLDDGEAIGADLVVVAKGIRPNVEWLRGSGVHTGRGIAVDLSGRTNIPGVFAAGDCAESADPLTGHASISGIWPVAYEMGRAAGSTAVGVERRSRGALRMNASRFFGVPVISIGEARPERLEGASAEVLANRDGVYRKLVFRQSRLAGALLFGDVSDAGSFCRQYREGWG